jgi:hypothetical protein
MTDLTKNEVLQTELQVAFTGYVTSGEQIVRKVEAILEDFSAETHIENMQFALDLLKKRPYLVKQMIKITRQVTCLKVEVTDQGVITVSKPTATGKAWKKKFRAAIVEFKALEMDSLMEFGATKVDKPEVAYDFDKKAKNLDKLITDAVDNDVTEEKLREAFEAMLKKALADKIVEPTVEPTEQAD